MSATSEICMHKFMPQASDEYANTKAKRLTGSFISRPNNNGHNLNLDRRKYGRGHAPEPLYAVYGPKYVGNTQPPSPS